MIIVSKNKLAVLNHLNGCNDRDVYFNLRKTNNETLNFYLNSVSSVLAKKMTDEQKFLLSLNEFFETNSNYKNNQNEWIVLATKNLIDKPSYFVEKALKEKYKKLPTVAELVAVVDQLEGVERIKIKQVNDEINRRAEFSREEEEGKQREIARGTLESRIKFINKLKKEMK